jgi:kinesin family protein 1
MSQSVSASDLASAAGRSDSPSVPDDSLVDWSYARRELALARLNGQDPALDHLRDEDLDKLFDDVRLKAQPDP